MPGVGEIVQVLREEVLMEALVGLLEEAVEMVVIDTLELNHFLILKTIFSSTSLFNNCYIWFVW